MANFLKKVINKQSSIRLISSLSSSLSHQKTPFNLTPHLFLNKDQIFNNQNATLNPNFSFDFDQKGGNGVGVGSHMGKMQEVYPSFSVGFFLNPGLVNGVELGGNVGDEAAERSGVVWADSVKKKRKKKMNKHKFKKLRKRLRKKTKKT